MKQDVFVYSGGRSFKKKRKTKRQIEHTKKIYYLNRVHNIDNMTIFLSLILLSDRIPNKEHTKTVGFSYLKRK